MKKETSIQWAKWLVLPLVLTACGGSSHDMTQVEDTAPKGAINAPTATAPAASAPTASAPAAKSDANSNSNSNSASNSNSNSNSNSSSNSQVTVVVKVEAPEGTKVSTQSGDNVTVVKPEAPKTENTAKQKEESVATTKKPEEAQKPMSAEEPKPAPLAKTEITPQLTLDVIKAKESIDNPGLPSNFVADYVITTANGTTTAKLKAPEGNGNNATQNSNNYFFNAGLLFPAGESKGTMKSFLLDEKGERKPHTEETFMSFQQFYSGISGSQKQVVYFDDGPNQRDEPFHFELPEGLLTQDLPAAGQATYHGKAIDGVRFGDFSYDVDFANKEGKGGKIIWDKSTAGNLGDITLEGGKLGAQVLSILSEPDLYPDHYSHRSGGVTGVAKIDGVSGKNYQYTAVFFGPKAEELGGLVYEQQENHGHSHGGLLGGGDTEKTNVASFTGER